MTQFIRYQYRQWTNLLNLDQVVKAVKSIDEVGVLTLHIVTTTGDMYLHDEDAAALWDALNAQPGIVEAQS